MSRILYVYLGFLPAVSWGGPVRIVQQNALALQQRGHHVTICASNLFDKRRRIARGCFERSIDGLRVVYLNTYTIPGWSGSLGPSWVSPGGIRRLWREIREADCVHVHGIRHALAVVAVCCTHLQGKPLVLQPHGTLQYIVSSVRLKKIFDSLFTRRALEVSDVLVASTPAERVQIEQAGGDPRRIEQVANGLPVDQYAAGQYRGRFRHRFAISERERILLFLGRINSKKGPDLLADAFALLPPGVRSTTRLVFAGPDDGQLNEVRARVSRHGLDERVLFTGVLTGEDILAAHVDADLFVLPCRTDTFPMALVEACQAGTPIIVTEGCEIAELLRAEAAIVTAADSRAIAGAIDRVLHDEALRLKLATGGRNLMKFVFSMDAVADRLETIYSVLVTNQRHTERRAP